MIPELQTFLAVSAAGSIQGAARHLPLTQSAITRQIQRLETLLGCTLLDRTVKPPRLTRDGELVRSRGPRLIEEVEGFRRSFSPMAEPEGVLRLGIAHAAMDWRGSGAIAQAMTALARACPRVTARLSAGWTPRLIGDLADGGLDAALVIGRSGSAWPSGASVWPIAADHLVAVASRRLGINRRTPFATLLTQPWILNPDGCGYRALLAARATASGHTIRVAAEAQGASLQHALIAAGLGVGLVPEGVARAWRSSGSAAGGLVAIRPDGAPFAITATLVATATTQRLARPIDAVRAALVASFARPPAEPRTAARRR